MRRLCSACVLCVPSHVSARCRGTLRGSSAEHGGSRAELCPCSQPRLAEAEAGRGGLAVTSANSLGVKCGAWGPWGRSAAPEPFPVLRSCRRWEQHCVWGGWREDWESECRPSGCVTRGLLLQMPLGTSEEGPSSVHVPETQSWPLLAPLASCCMREEAG